MRVELADQAGFVIARVAAREESLQRLVVQPFPRSLFVPRD